MALKINFATISKENDTNGVITFIQGFNNLSFRFKKEGIIFNKYFFTGKAISESSNHNSSFLLYKFKNYISLFRKTILGELSLFFIIFIFRPLLLSFKIKKYYKSTSSNNEILFFNDIFISYFTFFLIRKKINNILIIHSSANPLNQIYILFPKLNVSLFRLIMNHIYEQSLNNASEIITLSEELKNKLELKFSNVRTIYNTCFIEEQARNYGNKLFNNNLLKICCIGSLQHRKGFDMLINSLSYLNDGYKMRVKVYIAGDGPERSNLNQLINKHRLADSVFLLGNVSNVVPLINECDIYCMPSRDEGLSIALIESMCLGKPIIATKVGSITEIFSNDECIFIDPNYQSISKVLNDILSNIFNLDKLSNYSIFNYNQKLSNDNFVKSYTKVFKYISNCA
jgi:glycosyltransferase involved in cell wall biosynthesis